MKKSHHDLACLHLQKCNPHESVFSNLSLKQSQQKMNENYNGNMYWNKRRSPVISAAVGISCITVFFILSADFPLWALLINPIRSENSLLFISDCRPFEGTQNKILPDLDLAGFSLQIIILFPTVQIKFD